MVLLWSCISVPLCLLGTVVGRNWAGLPEYPCRVKRIPSPIPQKQVCSAALFSSRLRSARCGQYEQHAF